MIRRKISAAALVASLAGALERRDNELEHRHAGGALEIKKVSDAGEFEGHGSVFNVVDSYGDTVAPGAFKRTLDEHAAAGTLPAMLWQHDSAQPIGVYTEMKEDAAGLFVRGTLLTDTPMGKTAHTLLKAKALRGLSIGFITRSAERDEATGRRTVKDVDLWEVSLVTFPANRSAGVESVKNTAGRIETLRDLENALRDAGHSRAEAKAAIARVRSSILEGRDAAEGIHTAAAAAERLLKSLQA